MFSVQQKHDIAEAVQGILRDTGHPELPAFPNEVRFVLSVHGKEGWSFASIQNNGAVTNPTINPHNERQAGRDTGRGFGPSGNVPRGDQ